MNEPVRCPWCIRSAEEVAYHDEEWGVPQYEDRQQFEFLTLEAAQAGLSWTTILRKRPGYRRCFAEFSPEAVASFTEADVERLMGDAGIVRNRRKIEAAIHNARCFLEVVDRYSSFSHYIWSFVDGKPVQNSWTETAQIPATSALSDQVSKELKRLGFKFVGSTILYAHMQATGMINDHLVQCHRYEAVQSLAL